MSLSSESAVTVVPFNVNVTGFGGGCAATIRSRTVFTATGPPSRDFLRKVLDDRERRVGRRLPQSADRRIHHRLRQFFQQRLVPTGPFHEIESLGCADAAGRALAARLLGKEFHEI